MPPRDGNPSSGGDFAQDVMIARRRWFHRIDTFRAFETPAADRLRASFGELGTVGVARSLFELSRTILSDETRSLKNGHAEYAGTIPPVEATRSRRRRNRRAEVAGLSRNSKSCASCENESATSVEMPSFPIACGRVRAVSDRRRDTRRVSRRPMRYFGGFRPELAEEPRTAFDIFMRSG